MHDCRDMEQLLAAYADGELNKAEAERVEQHVANCPHCAALLDDYLALNKALASCAVKAPEGFADRVMDAVEKEKTAAPKVMGRGVRLGRIAPFVGVAAAAVICIGVVSTSLVRFVIKNLDDFEAVAPEEFVTDSAPETDANSSTGGGLGTYEASTIQPETAYEEVVTEAIPPAEDEPTENEPEPTTPEETAREDAWEGIETEEESARDESAEDSAEQTTTAAAGMTGEAIQTVPETAAPAPETENAPPHVESAAPETEKDRVTAEAPTEALTDVPVEVPTSAPTEDGQSTQASEQELPVAENAASAGLLARIWEAIVAFFESLIEGIERLFGGDA